MVLARREDHSPYTTDPRYHTQRAATPRPLRNPLIIRHPRSPISLIANRAHYTPQ